ncbi:MAG: hypothetical protein ASUL_08624 [Candidatus Aramenus sulfurataquae]|uniref:Uncharacterized protein n=1 Tax=Candidatus Aramenus sulfurataquae TaxID=1326980 RepID=W7L4W4_9CREN|nr:MAG: hypothetical protein ASUL_08624 [Candidatus Aramenus sulfurataquae]
MDILEYLTLGMVAEHFYVGTNALFRGKTVPRVLGIPLALFEIVYYTLLLFTLSSFPLPLLALGAFFVVTHYIGGTYYVLRESTFSGRKFSVAYSGYEFLELYFLIAVLLSA